jgi:hypothetical protein
MSERKSRRNENLIELDPEDMSFTLEPAKVEIGSGYAVNITYDEHDKQVIDIKTYGKVDLSKLQKEISEAFPHCRIRQLNHSPTVTIAKKDKKKRKNKP